MCACEYIINDGDNNNNISRNKQLACFRVYEFAYAGIMSALNTHLTQKQIKNKTKLIGNPQSLHRNDNRDQNGNCKTTAYVLS